MVAPVGLEPTRTKCPADFESAVYTNSTMAPENVKLAGVEGIEPPSLAWKAKVLPLNYTR